MAWCENHAVDYVLGLARNPRLRRKIARPLREAKREQQRTGNAARVFREFFYRTRRVGRARGAWWPRPSIWPREKIRASW